METLNTELSARAADGHKPATLETIGAALRAIGYRLDRSMDCRHIARWMSGPRAGASYPCISTGIKEIDSGRSFAHFESRRDANFHTLQDMRSSGAVFAVTRGHILEI